jgi:hypothetical protein
MGNNERVGKGDTYPNTDPHERELMQQMGEIACNRYPLQWGLAWIRAHKKECGARCLSRALAFWVVNPAAGLKRWVWNLYKIPLRVSAAVGVWQQWRRSPVTTPCFAILLIVSVVYYLTDTFDAHRLRLPFEALLTIFASTGRNSHR